MNIYDLVVTANDVRAIQLSFAYIKITTRTYFHILFHSLARASKAAPTL